MNILIRARTRVNNSMAMPKLKSMSITSGLSSAVSRTFCAIDISKMKIGVPKEIYKNEKRVSLAPEGVQILIKSGFGAVFVEKALTRRVLSRTRSTWRQVRLS